MGSKRFDNLAYESSASRRRKALSMMAAEDSFSTYKWSNDRETLNPVVQSFPFGAQLCQVRRKNTWTSLMSVRTAVALLMPAIIMILSGLYDLNHEVITRSLFSKDSHCNLCVRNA
jgi:hypothetical protein